MKKNDIYNTLQFYFQRSIGFAIYMHTIHGIHKENGKFFCHHMITITIIAKDIVAKTI
jgi:hypothetical protein